MHQSFIWFNFHNTPMTSLLIFENRLYFHLALLFDTIRFSFEFRDTLLSELHLIWIRTNFLSVSSQDPANTPVFVTDIMKGLFSQRACPLLLVDRCAVGISQVVMLYPFFVSSAFECHFIHRERRLVNERNWNML